MTTISRIHARQILDSRGNPTLEVDLELEDGTFGRAAVPSGASTGTHEAVEIRDGDKSVYGGKSVLKAVSNVCGPIADALKGTSVSDQRTLDQIMLDLDGTPNKSKLGANAILGVSMAVCRARAGVEHKPLWTSLADQFEVEDPYLLPMPMMNVINGGKHADSGLSFQECMIIPTGVATFTDAIRAGSETFHALKKLLKDAGYTVSVGDEGGFAPQVKNAGEAFDFLMKAIDAAGYTGKMQIGIDAAASEFYNSGSYDVDGNTLSSSELTTYYEELCTKYPLISIEDSHSEDDWDGFADLTAKLGDSKQLVGDDLLVTNVERIQKAIDEKTVNSVLIKLNQIGTVSETVDAIKLTQKNGWTAVVSHRSGETEDTFIAHLAVGLKTGQIKTGSLSRTDRVCKYNQLLRIEEQLGADAKFESPF
jgi:enolase